MHLHVRLLLFLPGLTKELRNDKEHINGSEFDEKDKKGSEEEQIRGLARRKLRTGLWGFCAYTISIYIYTHTHIIMTIT